MWMQVEISLQPWRAFQPDGVILFSDILTPLTGMNIPFDISAGKGPIIHDPIRTMEVRGSDHALPPISTGCAYAHKLGSQGPGLWWHPCASPYPAEPL